MRILSPTYDAQFDKFNCLPRRYVQYRQPFRRDAAEGSARSLLAQPSVSDLQQQPGGLKATLDTTAQPMASFLEAHRKKPSLGYTDQPPLRTCLAQPQPQHRYSMAQKLHRQAEGEAHTLYRTEGNENFTYVDAQVSYGRTPLSLAAVRGHDTAAELLVERDDLVDDSKDKRFRSPLSWAAASGHEEVVRLLVEQDNVVADSKDCHGQEDVVADSKDSNGRTPLWRAAARGHNAVAKLLVERDDVFADSKDKRSRTPLSWAAASGHEALLKLLQSHIKGPR
ncbi:hypothetical protein V500_01431 [Pseudogymnoascus sp. VKM F-4518 (FW-2643)]|nr:hypothetical protein V500_01431 [Pseudogymnoascus sp. VKM F-4518 (FW-2643)]